MKYITKSDKETKKVAQNLARVLTSRIIALSGDLGSGKTTFVQGFAEGLGIKEKITSPTFVLIRQHRVPKTKRTLYHIDLYRLKDHQELTGLGLEEILSNSQNIVLIEWAEKAKNLPKNATYINFKTLAENKREIIIKKFDI